MDEVAAPPSNDMDAVGRRASQLILQIMPYLSIGRALCVARVGSRAACQHRQGDRPEDPFTPPCLAV